MALSVSRRTFISSAAAIASVPAFCTRPAAADTLVLRCSPHTVPTHARNAAVRDFLDKIEEAARGRIKIQLYESGQLFPDLQVGKAILQGQIEMAVPGSWSLTGIVPDADFLQLPILYGRSPYIVHRAVDGQPGRLLAAQIEQRLNAHVIGQS